MTKENRDSQERRLWEQMKSGDERSLSEIFTIFYSDLYQYGVRVTNLPDLVKDSIQDVFLRLWERRQTIGEVRSPRAYLISSLRRRLLTNKVHLFKDVSASDLKREEYERFCFDISEFMEVEEISGSLRKVLINAVNGLPERQRELIFLRFYYNLHYLEIAPILDVNEQTVRNLMQRAMIRLRSQVDRRLWEDVDHLDDLLLILFSFCWQK